VEVLPAADRLEERLGRLEALMVQRIAASRALGERLRPVYEREDRAAAEPLELEAALESARASADLLHTLLGLESGRDRLDRARLEVYVRAPKDSARPLAPARLRLVDTPWSTFSEQVTEATADYYRGFIVLRNVPPGDYEAEVSRPGAAPHPVRVRLRSGERQRLSITLPAAG
jgi:hypothetical protein